ncbi:hypothetical protein BDY19DRAFT_1051374 [Irpex rosettiformis]|uniref:Uncharacterized protein n=1 Tax=Irpex rosettiformis TaxID=378272 RepID=A0ACB8TQL2_9APHY|nr:hypothetical protein BDY19DRAFT_1051374 [Irpex rosettiformis]
MNKASLLDATPVANPSKLLKSTTPSVVALCYTEHSSSRAVGHSECGLIDALYNKHVVLATAVLIDSLTSWGGTMERARMMIIGDSFNDEKNRILGNENETNMVQILAEIPPMHSAATATTKICGGKGGCQPGCQ